MFRLRVSHGKDVHRNICWINPDTARELGIKNGDIIIDADFGIAPLRVELSDLVKLGEIALPMTIMYRLGAYVGEERTFRLVGEAQEAKEVVLFVVGNIFDWLNYFRETNSIHITIDDEIPVSPRTSVRVIDIVDQVAPGEVYEITRRTKIRLIFSGPTNLAVAIDGSIAMLRPWRGRRRIDIAKEISKILLEYNLRKVNTVAIFSYAEDIDILLNWITIDPKLRGFMTKLIPNFVTDMIISRTEEPNLENALQKIIGSFRRRGLGGSALNSLLIIQASDPAVNENRIREIAQEFAEASNGVWRTFWVGIGGEEFSNLGLVAKVFGGRIITARTPLGLIKKCREYADFRHVDEGWA